MEEQVLCSFLLRQIYFVWERGINAFLSNIDLNLTQVEAIMALEKAEGRLMSLKQLEKRLKLTQSVVARMVNQLAADGYTEYVPDETDRRIKNVRLTEKGSRYCKGALDMLGKSEELLLEGMSPGEKLLFRELLERALENSMNASKILYTVKDGQGTVQK